MWKKIKPYVISIAIALAVGGLSALITGDNMNVYDTLNTPPLSPPSFIFGIVWPILYVLMGISAAMVYTAKGVSMTQKSSALKIYAIQLAVNFFWSIIFFNLRAFLFAFIWLILLWALILAMIIKFRAIRPWAGYLQIPYILWVSFALYLNLMIYILN